jgi:hypothetical protein
LNIIKHISKSGNATYFLNGAWKKEDICKMAHAMPSLGNAGYLLSKEEQDFIDYHEMPASAWRFICWPNNKDKPVLSHLFVDEETVQAAGA